MGYLLEKERFRVVEVFGGYDKRAYYKSGRMIFVAKLSFADALFYCSKY